MQQLMRLIAPTTTLPRNELVENPFPVSIHTTTKLNIEILIGDCESLKSVDSRKATERRLYGPGIADTI